MIPNQPERFSSIFIAIDMNFAIIAIIEWRDF